MAEHIQSTAFALPRLSLLRVRGRRLPRLEIASLPDHLKRDLGFLDGRASPARDILRD